MSTSKLRGIFRQCTTSLLPPGSSKCLVMCFIGASTLEILLGSSMPGCHLCRGNWLSTWDLFLRLSTRWTGQHCAPRRNWYTSGNGRGDHVLLKKQSQSNPTNAKARDGGAKAGYIYMSPFPYTLGADSSLPCMFMLLHPCYVCIS